MKFNVESFKEDIYKAIVLSSDNVDYAEFVRRNIRFTNKATTNISKILNRHNLKEVKVTCDCEKFKNLIGKEGHIHLKANDISEDDLLGIKNILIMNNRTPVLLDSSHCKETVRQCILKFMRDLRLEMSKSRIDKILDDICFRDVIGLKKCEVVRALKGLDNFVFIPLDKNNRTWSFTCRRFYLDKETSTFSDETYYEKSDLDKTIVMKRIESKYRNLLLGDRFYGNKDWKFNSACLLPKNKDLYRWRPLVSYFHNFSKRVGRYVGRCLTVLIRLLQDLWKNMNMDKCCDLTSKLGKLNECDKWKKKFGKGETTLIAFDLKEQFTNLNKVEIMKAVKEGLKRVWKKNRIAYFSIYRRLIDKARDSLGKKGNDFHILSFKEVKQYVKFELDTSYFEVADFIVKQKNGLPMGGFLSASLAQIDSMYKEHTARKRWRHMDVPSFWIRFRDDGRGLIAKRLCEPDIKKIETLLGEIYGKSLKVVIENWSYEEVTFLDARIIINTRKSKLEVRYFNKNIDLRKDDPSKQIPGIVRFPDVKSGWCRSVFVGVMIGAIKRVLRTCNSNEGYILGVLELIWEWIRKSYKVSMIEAAVRRSNIIVDDVVLDVLRAYAKARPKFPMCVS